MDLNLTLVGQIITFVVFVLFTMKFVWPPITKALADREKKIADGLAAGAKGEQDLELARQKAMEILQEARTTAGQIIDQANSRAVKLFDEARETSRQESERLIHQAQAEINQQIITAQQQLRSQVAGLAIDMAEKIVQHDIDANTHQKLLDKMLQDIEVVST